MNPLKDVKAYYDIGPEKMDPVKKDSIVLNGKPFVLDGGTLSAPGFLRWWELLILTAGDTADLQQPDSTRRQ